MNKNIYTAKQLSLYFNIPLRTIYYLTKQGKIKGIKIGKHWRYKELDIESHLSFGTDFSNKPARLPNDSTLSVQGGTELIEHRLYPRMNCDTECIYSVNLPGKNSINKGKIINISGGGLLLYDRCNINDIRIEDPVILEFKLNTSNNPSIKTEGRVVRKANGYSGIKFRNIDKYYQELLIKYVG